MLVRLPRNVAALSQCAAKAEHTRFGATTGIKVKVTDDQVLHLQATDGRILGMVRCPQCLDGDWERAEAVVDAQNLDPDDQTGYPADVVVPLDVWTKGFKLDEDQWRDKGAVVIATEGNAITFATHVASRRTECVEGRFPNFDKVFPHANGHKPQFSVNVDPKLMIRLLQCAMACTSEDVKAVTLIYYGPGIPIGVMCRHPENQQAFDGLLVPLVSEEESRRAKALPAPKRPALPAPEEEIEACRGQSDPLPKLSELFHKVEYDPKYRGGNYRGQGQVALVPVSLADTLGLDEAFRRTTGLDPIHVVNCSIDDLYDADGNFVEEWESDAEDAQEEEPANEE
jgi:hypothetical protein